MQSSDLDLVQAWARRRDADAYTEVYARHASLVFGVCLRILRNTGDAEDVAQECFMELARSGGYIRTSVPAWLHRLATRRSLDKIRGDQRRLKRETSFASDRPVSGNLPWSDIEEHIDQAVSALPEKERALVIERYFNGISEGALAERFGLTRSQVRYRLDKAVERIRRRLRAKGIVASAIGLHGMFATRLSEASAIPPSLNAAVARIAVSGIAPTSALGAAVLPALSMTLKPAIALAALVATGLVVAWYSGHQRELPVRAEASVERPAGTEESPDPSPEPTGLAGVQVAGDESALPTNPDLEVSIYVIGAGEASASPPLAPPDLTPVIRALEAEHGIANLALIRTAPMSCPQDHALELSYLINGAVAEQFGPITYPSDATPEVRKAAGVEIKAKRNQALAQMPPDGDHAGNQLGPQVFLVRFGTVSVDAATGKIRFEKFVVGMETPVLEGANDDRRVSRIALGVRMDQVEVEGGRLVVLGKGEPSTKKEVTQEMSDYIARNPFFVVIRARVMSQQ